jgi:rhodanese-related sulfurtransferase
MTRTPFLALLVLVLAACSAEPSSAQLAGLNDPDAVILDVRTPGEFAAGHLVGAQNINVADPDFAARLAGFDRDQSVYLYCASGGRSGRALQMMEGMGFTNAVNLGGYNALKASGAAVEE